MLSRNSKAPTAGTVEASILTTIGDQTDMKTIAKASADFTMFKFGDKEIRVLSKDGEPWFVAKDVCDSLGLVNSRKALISLDDDEKGVTLSYTLKGNQEVAIVSESGMYTLVLRCRDAIKPGTVPHTFRKWVTSEVLPTIRKTGEYQASKPRQTTATQLTPLRQTVERLITTGLGRIYPDIWKLVHHRFEVEHINQLTKSQVTEAIEYLDALEGEYISKHQSEERWCNAKELDFKLEMIDRIWQSAKEDIAKFDPNMSRYLDGSMNMLAMYSSSLKGKGICSDGRKLKKVAR
ncbi:putative antirepressor protein Ant [Edwardsiella phage GF-2]|uniref:Putative antirepressor protein Ant n=2 Tax=root TaxID=1 RepID=A0A077KC96_9CAUD|nr:anti-repressor Ant [Edwardsiella phage GF-2]BAP28894.1 putative antirepressor protein Ant [Edwardsiella phage GF-2]